MQTVLDGRLKLDGAVLALGMFDGVHIGHRVLMRKARALANAAGAPLVVCTFATHPMALIAPERTPALLTTFEERSALLARLHTDVLYAMPFDRSVMNQPPECYVGELVRRFHPTDVVCGYNHSFGKNGGGSPALLTALGAALGFATHVVPRITLNGADVSSTAIRQALERGEADTARKMLARPYARLAAPLEQAGERRVFALRRDGKQDVRPGGYRVTVSSNQQNLPAVLRLEEGGRAICRLPLWAKPEKEVSIAFLHALA